MTRLGRHGAGGLALICLVLAVLLGLLATDVRTVRTTVSRDDIRFRSRPAHGSLWKPNVMLPGNPAADLLGSSDTMAYRHAIQLFLYSRLSAAASQHLHEDLPTIRAEAQQELQDEMDAAWVPQERSSAANLLGVLVVTTPVAANDHKLIAKVLKRSAGYFQRAIALDPANDDAKQNLELVLRVTKPSKKGLDHDARSGFGFGSGHALVPLGSGY
jgi:hypothetical protein